MYDDPKHHVVTLLCDWSVGLASSGWSDAEDISNAIQQMAVFRHLLTQATAGSRKQVQLFEERQQNHDNSSPAEFWEGKF